MTPGLSISTSLIALTRALVSATAMALIAGCASGPRQTLPMPLIVTLKADGKVNPDSHGRPSPLRVVFYELKSAAAFESADFFSLSQKDQATIGSELLGREEFFLRPGESKTLTRKGYPETTTVGVFVEYREIDKSVWRTTAAVPKVEEGGILSSIKVGGPAGKTYLIYLDQRSVKIAPQ